MIMFSSLQAQLFKLKGEIKSIQQEYIDRKDLQEIAKAIIFLIEAIEICDLIGVQHAVECLSDTLRLPSDISKLKDSYAGSVETPKRLAYLEEILQKCTPETKVIIFVRTQVAVVKLHSHLQKRFPDLQPRMMLGHAGFHGMGWEEEQKPVLKEFREDKSGLLVSTSVLEEGLDVASCNLVIRYSGELVWKNLSRVSIGLLVSLMPHSH